LGDLSLVHGLGIAIDQQHFIAGRSQRLEEKHPEMRHEVAGYTVVRAVEQDPHDFPLFRRGMRFTVVGRHE
jgi:hypothetical protein